MIGQMNWVATLTRPVVLFDCCELASNLKNATVTDMAAANKILKNIQEKVVASIRQLKDGSSFKFMAYSDSSYANLKDGRSQGGFIIFLIDADSVKLLQEN